VASESGLLQDVPGVGPQPADLGWAVRGCLRLDRDLADAEATTAAAAGTGHVALLQTDVDLFERRLPQCLDVRRFGGVVAGAEQRPVDGPAGAPDQLRRVGWRSAEARVE
jgi:hypothetical protein